jgi:hypothetical protein
LLNRRHLWKSYDTERAELETCPCRKPHLAGGLPRIGRCCRVMRDLFRIVGLTVVDLFRSRAALEAEIWTLRQQINVLRRTAPKDSRSASSTAWYSSVSIGCFQRFAQRSCNATQTVAPMSRWSRRADRSSDRAIAGGMTATPIGQGDRVGES